MRDFRKEYMEKLRTPEEAVQVVKSGDWVDYTSSLGKPVLLDRALAKRRDELYDVKIRGNLISGPLRWRNVTRARNISSITPGIVLPTSADSATGGSATSSPWYFTTTRRTTNISSMSMWRWSACRPWTGTDILIIR